MPSSFVEHYVQPVSTLSRRATELQILNTRSSPQKDALRSLLSRLQRAAIPLEESTSEFYTIRPEATERLTGDLEEEEIVKAITSKLSVLLYGEALDVYLAEACQLEAEAEWWLDIEHSTTHTLLYLLQTLPHRLVNLLQTIIHALRTRNIPIHPSNFTPTSLRRLFPSDGTLRPNALTISMFPHLQSQSSIYTLSILSDRSSFASSVSSSFTGLFKAFKAGISIPIELTRQECAHKRKRLEKLRDERATTLGELSGMRRQLFNSLHKPADLERFLAQLGQTIDQGEVTQPQILHYLATEILPSHRHNHRQELESQQLLRPSRLTLLWPRLVFIPPILLFAIKTLYSSRDSLFALASDGVETFEQFVRGWLLEPLRDVINTVRAGRDDGIIVKKEGIMADLASLERMAVSLAQDRLQYTADQLAELSEQVRTGDLTPVLQIYEDDIKRPLRSAVSGTLLRSLFIQVQKAKVDIDQALSGIDKLLRSQELTFAFVGVAPAFGVVYIASGVLLNLLFGGRESHRYGDKVARLGAWQALRRVERLLITQSGNGPSSQQIKPLTTGLLLLSMTRLRTYAETHLPTNSRLREGFLEDVGDLEDAEIGRDDKMKIVGRMWQSWGDVLGWKSIVM